MGSPTRARTHPHTHPPMHTHKARTSAPAHLDADTHAHKSYAHTCAGMNSDTHARAHQRDNISMTMVTIKLTKQRGPQLALRHQLLKSRSPNALELFIYKGSCCCRSCSLDGQHVNPKTEQPQ